MDLTPRHAVLVLCAILAALVASCSAETALRTPEEAATFSALQREEEAAQAAVLAGEPGAAERLKAAQEALARFEARLLRERYGAVVSALGSVPVVGPWIAALGPLAAGLVPLAGKRGRRHYWNAVRELNPWTPGKGGGVGNVSPLEAGRDVLRALGVLHSSDASERAASAPQPPVA